MADSRRVWRAAPATLTVVTVFGVLAGLGIPVLAYLIYRYQGNIVVAVFLGVLAVLGVAYAWRFGWRPRIRADEDGIEVVNPARRTRFAWEDVTVLAPGPDGLVVATQERRAEAWCVQKSNLATRRGRRVRADRVAHELAALADANDPGAEDEGLGARVRRARHDDADLLTDLERTASEAALGHIFPPDEVDYPTDEVTLRWYRVLRDARVHVRLLDLADEPVGYLAYDSERIRHLGVLPDHARQGLGSLLLQHASDELFGRGARAASLWVLVDNTDARKFFTGHGWTETDERRDCEFPPFPPELQLVRINPARRSR